MDAAYMLIGLCFCAAFTGGVVAATLTLLTYRIFWAPGRTND